MTNAESSMAMAQPAYELAGDRSSSETPAGSNIPSPPRFPWGRWLAGLLTSIICLLHDWATWVGIGGRAGMTSDWPILMADHGFHLHHALLTRNFLLSSGLTAGYDPSFMSGYSMSIVTGTSSTLINLVILAFGGDRPAVAFKVFTFACSASLPWLAALAMLLIRASPRAVVGSVALFTFYFWTDAPVYYANFGMTSYVLSGPVGLIAVALLADYLAGGGAGRWSWAAMACAGVFLVHLTSAMVVGPAGLLAYLVAMRRARRGAMAFPASRHVGVLAIVPIALLVNAFWLLPGYWLSATAGKSDFLFIHPESLLKRLGEIVWTLPPIESFSLALALVGLGALARRRPEAAAGLGGMLLAGFAWGYLAGASRWLDPLQPGRQTYICYSAACLAAGIGLDEVLKRLRAARPMRLDLVAMVGLAMVGVRVFGPSMVETLRNWNGGGATFLSSQPAANVVRVIEQVKAHVRPGERLYFEETGFPVEEHLDPFEKQHLSPILPHLTGVEVIGGPYLHTPVDANFTQFGENKLFGRKVWDRDFFIRHARLYRPSAICCWTQKARAFCEANPDLVRVVWDDGLILLGRVVGFEGAAIRGSASVEAGPNRLVVRDAVAGPDAGPDGLVVLRYHAVPYLVADPPTAIERVKLEDDPVPFIAIRPTKGPVTIRMVLPIQAHFRK